MPVVVVDALEAIDVEEDHRQPLVEPLSAGHSRTELLVDMSAVRQAGDGIVQGGESQPFVAVVVLGHVARRDDDTLARRRRAGDRLDPHLTTVSVPHPVGHPGHPAGSKSFEDGLRGGEVLRVSHVDEAQPDQLVGAVTQEVNDGSRGEHDPVAACIHDLAQLPGLVRHSYGKVLPQPSRHDVAGPLPPPSRCHAIGSDASRLYIHTQPMAAVSIYRVSDSHET